MLFCLVALFLATNLTYAQVQQDCGATDCPGRCGRFIDQNGDGFCDRGQLSKPAKAVEPKTPVTPVTVSEPEVAKTPVKTEDKSATTKDAATVKNSDRKETTTTPTPAATTPTEKPTANEEICESADKLDVAETTEEETPVKTKSPYSLILISSITLGLYILSVILVKANVWKKATHRKVWNVLLLITGLVSCLFGFFLVIQINYNLKMDWFWTVKLYHVQLGIAMTIIMVIHILWHLNYWKSVFKAGSGKQ